MSFGPRRASSSSLPLRALLALTFFGAIASPFVSAGCADSRACLLWSADKGPCPSRDAAFLMMGNGCNDIRSITSDGEFDEDVCCYDVRKSNELVPCASTAGPPPPTPGPISGVTTGPAISCFGVFSGACDDCMQNLCCSEVASCVETPSCLPCLDAKENCTDQAGGQTADFVDLCARSLCPAECFDGMPGPKPACAPINAGGDLSCSTVAPEQNIFCDALSGDGCIFDEVCDVTPTGTACQAREFWSGNCGTCGATGWCGPGTTCVSGVCTPFCCEDSQCVDGYCDKTILTGMPGPIGACLAGEGGAGGAGGAGGQGGAGGSGGGGGK